MSGALYAVTLAAALGCGLVAGVFFAFSSFVMAALKRLPTTEGVAAMQAINALAVTPMFMMVFFGTAVACLASAGLAVISADGLTVALALAGGALYIFGVVGVTIARNVPLNERLAGLRPRSADAAGVWGEYVNRWTVWNHLRTAASLVASAILTFALHG